MDKMLYNISRRTLSHASRKACEMSKKHRFGWLYVTKIFNTAVYFAYPVWNSKIACMCGGWERGEEIFEG